ncbi:MAG: hypothetical protein AAGJ35_15085 [Myxococcota bacterium]
MEKTVLGNVRYYDDVSITHLDKDYMAKYFKVHEDRDEMYFVRTYPDSPSKIEMAFNLSHYQPWLLDKGAQGLQWCCLTHACVFSSTRNEKRKKSNRDMETETVSMRIKLTSYT